MEQGVYIIDRQGVIRYRQVLGALDMIPTAETLVQLTVELCL